MRFWPLQVDYKKAMRLIRKAVDSGVNYFDTGWPYHLGQSEKVLGMALAGGYREKVHLVTKLPMFMVSKADDFDRFLHGQLEKLQTNYLDTYLFHSMDKGNFRKVVDFKLIDKMEKAREKGLIKYIGFSFHDTLPVFKQIVDYYPWDVVQIQYNYLDTSKQATTQGLEYAYSKNMAVVIMEPLKGGLLANPPQDVMDLLEKAQNNRKPVEWALRFLWDKKEVSVVLSGMGSEKMLDENCAYAHDAGPGCQSEADTAVLGSVVEIYEKQIAIPCTACQYCMPCPFGVNIPENFALMNAVNIKISNLQDRIFRWLDKRKYKKMASVREKVNKNKPDGNASLCTRCGQCLSKCPQSINIPDELAKCHQVLGPKKSTAKLTK